MKNIQEEFEIVGRGDLKEQDLKEIISEVAEEEFLSKEEEEAMFNAFEKGFFNFGLEQEKIKLKAKKKDQSKKKRKQAKASRKKNRK